MGASLGKPLRLASRLETVVEKPLDQPDNDEVVKLQLVSIEALREEIQKLEAYNQSLETTVKGLSHLATISRRK